MGKTRISTTHMTDEQWLATRKIGGSDVASILGFGYRTPLEVYLDKIGEGTPIEETAKMRMGTRQEQTIADEYAFQTGRIVLRDNAIHVHPKYEFLTACLDRTVRPTNGEGRGILECKNTTSRAIKYWQGEIPLHFYTQCQHYLDVVKHKGFEWLDLAYLIDGWDLRIVRIVPDWDYIEKQREMLVNFWNNHVVPRVPPPMMVTDLDMAITDKDSIVDITDEIQKDVDQLVELKAEKSSLEKRVKEIQDRVELFIGTREILQSPSGIVATFKPYEQVRVDSKKLQAEFKEAAAACCKVSQYRKFDLKVKKEKEA